MIMHFLSQDREGPARTSSCPLLPASRQLADHLGVEVEELYTPARLPSLLEAVGAVPDPRSAHLVTYPLPMLLGLMAACAVLCGVRSVRGVIRWANGQGAGILAALEVPGGDMAMTSWRGCWNSKDASCCGS